MSAEPASAERRALDDLLAALQHCRLSVLELRILIRLAARETAQSELADALQTRSGTINRAIRRLAMRGLIARRFERGPRSRFVLSITSSGLLAVAPLVERVAEAQAAGDDGLGRHARSAVGTGSA
ncbi:MAG: MarR family transcriptional regulator [Actinomycetota bacterium]|nr:MarR family transcriptional regulator [Actinomycetota bacterium]